MVYFVETCRSVVICRTARDCLLVSFVNPRYTASPSVLRVSKARGLSGQPP